MQFTLGIHQATSPVLYTNSCLCRLVSLAGISFGCANEIIPKQKGSYKVVCFCSFCSPPLLHSSNKVWPWEHGEQTVSVGWGGLITWAGRVSLSTRPAVCHITARQKAVLVLAFTVPGPGCVPQLCWIVITGDTSVHKISVRGKMCQWYKYFHLSTSEWSH